jgi:hypothetical protein
MRSATFEFDGETYAYCDAAYNHSADNMRSVEIPIAQRFMATASNALEVGNVLAHYGVISWPVVDWREGGIKENVMTWQPPHTFARIVSISTLEHIDHGRYKTVRPYSPRDIVKRLYRWLASGGELLATIPIGYNRLWDEALMAATLGARALYMRRLNAENEWEQCCKEQAFAVDPRRWHKGGALVVLRWQR